MAQFNTRNVAWLLVLAALLWFGGNYAMDHIYKAEAVSDVQELQQKRVTSNLEIMATCRKEGYTEAQCAELGSYL